MSSDDYIERLSKFKQPEEKEVSLAICRRCRGQCCYGGLSVVLDREKEERKLHLYRYENKVLFDEDGLISRPVVKKRIDGSCVYFDREARRCLIYDRRPWCCRTFFCGRGRKDDRDWKALLENVKHDVAGTLEKADRRAKCAQSNP